MGRNKIQKVYTNQDSKISINEAFSEERFEMHSFLDRVWIEYEVYCVDEGIDPDINQFLSREWRRNMSDRKEMLNAMNEQTKRIKYILRTDNFPSSHPAHYISLSFLELGKDIARHLQEGKMLDFYLTELSSLQHKVIGEFMEELRTK